MIEEISADHICKWIKTGVRSISSQDGDFIESSANDDASVESCDCNIAN